MSTSPQHPTRRRIGPKVFISYRRVDSYPALGLKDKLTDAFGDKAVFRDDDDIKPGERFTEAIREAIASCDVFLVLISPNWLGALARLREPDDLVRREIADALARRVTLIPVLIDDARMPKPGELPEEVRELADLQAFPLSQRWWKNDIQRLIDAIRARDAETPPPTPPGVTDGGHGPGSYLAAWWVKAALAALLLAGGIAVWYALSDKPPDLGEDGNTNLSTPLPTASPSATDSPMSTPTAANSLAPDIRGVTFEDAAGCAPDYECFWSVASGGGAVVRTGRVDGSNLTGGSVSVSGPPGLTDVKAIADGSSDRSLRFAFKLTQSVPAGSKLFLKVSKPPGGTAAGAAPLESQPWLYSIAFMPSPQSQGGATPDDCLGRLLPPGRSNRVEYGDAGWRVVVRPDQPLEGSAGVLFTENGRPVGALKFSFIRSGDEGVFNIEQVFGPDCRPAADYGSDDRPGVKEKLRNHEYLRMRLGQKYYDLRVEYRPPNTLAVQFMDRPDKTR